jgi:glutathione S-transferase
MKLYEFPPTRSIRARWTLQELGLDFEAISIDLRKGEHVTPAFRKLNPAAKLPVLVDGDFVLTESVAIALYLGHKFPDRGFVPSGVREEAELQRWLLFAATELEQPLWRIARHTSLYPPQDRSPAEVALARREFTQMVAVAEEHMRGREFVLGDRVSVGDFVLAYTLDWANETKLLEDAPTLLAYMERMYARPRAAPRIAQAFASLPKL